MGLQLRPAMAPAMDTSTSNMTGTSGNAKWEQLAEELWLSRSHTSNAKLENVKSRIWDPLEAAAFNWRSLATLESLQILERYVNEQHMFGECFADKGQGIYGLLTRRTLLIILSSSSRPLWVSNNEHMFRYGVSPPIFTRLVANHVFKISSWIAPNTSRVCSSGSFP